MRWLGLLFFLTPLLSHGVTINNPDAISAAIADEDAFKFFYIGHAYGAHNGGGGKKKVVYPHPEIIRLLDHLKQYNFGVFGGDVVEICNKQSVSAFEDYFLQPLGLPLINSTGNHDNCMQDIYNYPSMQAFSRGKNIFLIISTNERRLGIEKIQWLRNQIEKANKNPATKRIFIFTHRPTFLLLDPALNRAAISANFSVMPDKNFTNAFNDLTSLIDESKTLYWFAGDMGMRLPFAYKKLANNVHLIASGVYERNNDHYLDVNINGHTVTIKSVNFLSGETSDIQEYTDKYFVEKQYLPGEAFDEGWAESLLAKLYASVDTGKKIRLYADSLKLDTTKAFDFYYLPDSKSILLDKTNCGVSGDAIFFVQFHPTRVENRRVRARPWNGYHFYASRTDKDKNKCIATFPLPDYPYNFILTGQLNDKNISWKAKILPPELSTGQ